MLYCSFLMERIPIHADQEGVSGLLNNKRARWWRAKISDVIEQLLGLIL